MVGRTVLGWVVAGVDRTPSGDAAVVVFTRGEARVEVRFQRASDAPRFARVGAIDVSHSRVDEGLLRDVGDLIRRVAAVLERRGIGALAPLLIRPDAVVAAPAPAVQAYDGAEAPELDATRRTDPARPFMRFDTIDIDDMERYPDALRQMYEGTLGGLVIRNVYSKDAMARITAQLEAGNAAYPRTEFPARFKAHFYGRCLDGSDPELTEYLPDAARFRDETLKVFSESAPFEQRVEEMFRRLSGGRAVQVPRFRDGRPYTAATIRHLYEHGQIGTHCGNEAATRPAYTHLNTLIDRGDQISFFLTLQGAEQGGELIVYSLKWSDIDASHIVDGRSQVNDLLKDAEWMAVAPGAGDLLLFDGGRYFHRVSKVVGGRDRWTIGGFMMFSHAGETVYYWS